MFSPLTCPSSSSSRVFSTPPYLTSHSSFKPFLSPALPYTGLLIWDYYVTMPMPASTFTLAVGCWRRAIAEPHTASWSAGEAPVSEYSGVPANTDAEPRAGSQTGPMSRPGSSTRQVIKGFPLNVGRNYINFPELLPPPTPFGSSLMISPSPDCR